MYRLLNLLFGWDYINWKNSCDSGIARVRLLPTGDVVYTRYWSTSLVDVIDPKDPKSIVGGSGLHRILWLTCKPSKYFK